MSWWKPLAVVALCFATGASAVMAQNAAMDPASVVKARRDHMSRQADFVGVLAKMAQGRTPFNAGEAKAAAEGLVKLARMDWTTLFPAGTASGEVPRSEAVPAIWENMADFTAKKDALITVASEIVDVASTDMGKLRGSIGKLANACNACHKPYRLSN